MTNMTRQKPKIRDSTKVKFHISRIGGRAPCRAFQQAQTPIQKPYMTPYQEFKWPVIPRITLQAVSNQHNP